MRQLSSWQRFWLFLLGPLVLLCLGLSIAQNVSGRLGSVHITVTAPDSPQAYPRLRRILDDRVAEQSQLRPGDLLLRAGDQSLRGTGPFTFYAAVLEAAPKSRLVPIEFERNGQRMQTVLDVAPLSPARVITGILLGLTVLVIFPLILLRAPRDHRSLYLFVGFSFFALNQMWFQGGPRVVTYAWFAVSALGEAGLAPLVVLIAVRWLDRPVSRWALVLPWALVVKAPLRAASMHDIWLPADAAMTAFLVLDAAMIIAVLAYSIRNYRVSDALGRRQLRWVNYGVFVVLTPLLVLNLAIAFEPSLLWLRPHIQITVFLVPFGFLIGILRYDLFDIDRLISSTTSYSILSVLVLAGILALVPRLAEAAGTAVGVDPSSAQVVFSVALAAIAIPLHRSLRPRIDRVFFPERCSLEDGMERLLGELAHQDDFRQLTALAGEQLQALLRPECCVVYARFDEAFSPVFTRGRGIPPAVARDSPLVTTVESHSGALVAARSTRRTEIAKLSLFDRAALESLGVVVIVPVRRQGELVAFLCLGAKRSGDIYTPTELTLLTAVADRVSIQLDRFEDADVVSEARAMQEKLRRYVPGAVAKGLEAGEVLGPRERVVSVLFVDIRDYVSMSEGRRPEEIFATVNRYTTAVSSVVEKFGGSIVEFNGDGMMVVFGAPQALEDKESAAVAAGREIVATVPSIPGSTEAGGILVGVGIATGAAFVGSIRSVDRLIWTALGNTTNLAARLQGLTRDMDAAMVIDVDTWRAAGGPPEFARREQVPIRGLSQPRDLYVLYSVPQR